MRSRHYCCPEESVTFTLHVPEQGQCAPSKSHKICQVFFDVHGSSFSTQNLQSNMHSNSYNHPPANPVLSAILQFFGKMVQVGLHSVIRWTKKENVLVVKSVGGIEESQHTKVKRISFGLSISALLVRTFSDLRLLHFWRLSSRTRCERFLFARRSTSSGA